MWPVQHIKVHWANMCMSEYKKSHISSFFCGNVRYVTVNVVEKETNSGSKKLSENQNGLNIVLDKIWNSRLCSTVTVSKLKRENKRKRRGGKESRRRGRREIQRGGNRTRNEERDSRLTLLYFHSLQKMWENTIRLQQPTAYKPMLERKAVKLYFTQSTLTHYPIDQLYNALC